MFTQVESDILKETIYYKRLDNGLKFVFMPKPGYTKKYAIYATQYGSIDNNFVVPGDNNPTKVPDGIAHFLEHKMFEEEQGNVFDDFSKYGASANAFTSFNMTAYLFSCTDNFYQNLDTLVGFVSRPYFTRENVEKEKGIIGQEIRMYQDSPEWRVYFNLLNALYKDHPVKIDIAGTIESIAQIDKDVLYKCYNTFYNPGNMVLFVVGDLDYQALLQQLQTSISDTQHVFQEIKRFYPEEPDSINKKVIEQRLQVSVPLFNMGFKEQELGISGKELLKRQISTDILLEMLLGKSSELYNKLYETGLINNTFDKEYVGQKIYGHTIIGGESKQPRKVENEILNHIKKVKKSGLDYNYFERIKKKMFGDFLNSFNSVDFIAYNFVSYYMNDISFFDYLKVLQDIDIDEIDQRLNEHFNDDNQALSIIMPI
ncbi:MAG: pitrilysin family protein [Clostridia bacterium]|nr:pitrilysin family protein [Clostridia bacterium]